MKGYADILDRYKREGRLRAVPSSVADGCIDLSINDYLGLTLRTELAEEFIELVGIGGFTSAASRLLASGQDEYAALESWLSSAYGKRALLFNSGYHANTGCISALSIPGTCIVADKLVHASIIDGIALSKLPYKRFRHNDIVSLRRELERVSAEFDRVLLIVESIYSMDGDIAPLSEIADLKKEFPKTILYVDEAHAIGVRGDRGLGICEETGLLPDVDILVGTFGKACASMGAFVVTSDLLRSFLINTARSFIFSTALPPVNVAYTLFLLRKIADMKSERAHLARISNMFAAGLSDLTGVRTASASQIVPLMAGSSQRAVEISEALRRKGILALPIRRPTVPPGTERIRFSLNASLSEEDVEHVLRKVSSVL